MPAERRRRLEAGLAGLGIAVLWIAFAVSLAPLHRVEQNDLPAYWEAGRLALTGDLSQLYAAKVKHFMNLPAVALLFAPLGRLSYAGAWWLFWWLQVAAFAATYAVLLWIVRRRFPPLTAPRALLAAAIFLCFAPVLRRCLFLGQTTPLLVLALALAVGLHQAGRRAAAGLLLGAIAVIKIPPLLLLPLLALRRRLVVATAAAGVVLATVAISWLGFGTELLVEYVDRAVLGYAGKAQGAFNNRGLDGVFMRLLTDASLLDWYPDPRPLRVTLALAASFAALGVVLWRSGGADLLWPPAAPRDDDPRSGSFELELTLGVALMLLVFPVVWIHYYLFLAVPLVLLPFWWQQRGIPPSGASVLLIVVGALLASGTEVPPNHVVGARLDDLWFRHSHAAQPIGALLLVLGLTHPLAEIARRQRAAPAV